jgi:transglutaminase-like putative cysteine protease
MQILDNTLIAIAPFPLLPLESLLKGIYIFIGGHIEFDVEYLLNFCVTYVPYSNLPGYQLDYHTPLCPIKITNIQEFNNFVTIEYENTVYRINSYWNANYSAHSTYDLSPRIGGEP